MASLKVEQAASQIRTRYVSKTKYITAIKSWGVADSFMQRTVPRMYEHLYKTAYKRLTFANHKKFVIVCIHVN